jgi:(2Fe-2S) ferredoxin
MLKGAPESEIIQINDSSNNSKFMKKPSYHILVCNSYRLSGEAQGACNRKNAPELIRYMMENAADRGLDVAVTGTGCLNLCAQGPIMIVHPDNIWYGGITTEEQMDEILEALENGEAVSKYAISE